MYGYVLDMLHILLCIGNNIVKYVIKAFLITYNNVLCASSGGLGEVDEGGRSCQRRVAASRQGLAGDEETAGEYEEGHPSGNTSCTRCVC